MVMSLNPSFLSCQTKSMMLPWVSRRVMAFVRCPSLSLANPVFIRMWKNDQQQMYDWHALLLEPMPPQHLEKRIVLAHEKDSAN